MSRRLKITLTALLAFVAILSIVLFVLRKPVVTPEDLQAAAAVLYEGTPPPPPSMEVCVTPTSTPVQIHGVVGAREQSVRWTIPPLAGEAAVRTLMDECVGANLPVVSPLSSFDATYATIRFRELEGDASGALVLALGYHRDVLGSVRSGTDTAFDGLAILKPLHDAIAALLSRHPELAVEPAVGLRAQVRAELEAFSRYDLLEADRARSARHLLDGAEELSGRRRSRFETEPETYIPQLAHARLLQVLECEEVGARECQSRIQALVTTRERAPHPLAITYWIAGRRVEQDYLIDRAMDNDARAFFRYHRDLEAALGELVMLQEVYQAWMEDRESETVETAEWGCRITQVAVGSNASETRVGGPCGRFAIGGGGLLVGLLAIRPER